MPPPDRRALRAELQKRRGEQQQQQTLKQATPEEQQWWHQAISDEAPAPNQRVWNGADLQNHGEYYSGTNHRMWREAEPAVVSRLAHGVVKPKSDVWQESDSSGYSRDGFGNDYGESPMNPSWHEACAWQGSDSHATSYTSSSSSTWQPALVTESRSGFNGWHEGDQATMSRNTSNKAAVAASSWRKERAQRNDVVDRSAMECSQASQNWQHENGSKRESRKAVKKPVRDWSDLGEIRNAAHGPPPLRQPEQPEQPQQLIQQQNNLASTGMDCSQAVQHWQHEDVSKRENWKAAKKPVREWSDLGEIRNSAHRPPPLGQPWQTEQLEQQQKNPASTVISLQDVLGNDAQQSEKHLRNAAAPRVTDESEGSARLGVGVAGTDFIDETDLPESPPAPSEPSEFQVRLDRSFGQILGIRLTDEISISSVLPKGLLAIWNLENPSKRVIEGDCIVSVNGRTDCIAEELKKEKMLEIQIRTSRTILQLEDAKGPHVARVVTERLSSSASNKVQCESVRKDYRASPDVFQSKSIAAQQSSSFGEQTIAGTNRRTSHSQSFGLQVQDECGEMNSHERPPSSNEPHRVAASSPPESSVVSMPLQATEYHVLGMQESSVARSKEQLVFLEHPASWLDTQDIENIDALFARWLQVTQPVVEMVREEVLDSEVPDSWEVLSANDEDVAPCATVAPWYSRSFLLLKRWCPSCKDGSDNDGWQLHVASRPRSLEAPRPRLPSEEVLSAIRNIGDDGVSLALSPSTGTATGMDAIGVWQECERLSWSLLQLSDPPFIDRQSDLSVAKWRIHCVGAHARPEDFRHSHCVLEGQVGPWTEMTLWPGILEVELLLQRGKTSVQVLAAEHQNNGRQIRSLELAQRLSICVEHRRPVTGIGCLCVEALAEANVASTLGLTPASDIYRWESSADYVAAWRAAVELEAAASAIQDGELTRLLFGLEIVWGRGGTGTFQIPASVAAAHRLKLRSIISSSDGPAEWGSGWLCLRRPANSLGRNRWSGHAAVVGATLIDDEGEQNIGFEDDERPPAENEGQQKIVVTFSLSENVSDPAPRLGSRQGDFIAEFLPKSLPYSCMAAALSELVSSSEVLQNAVLLGHVPQQSESCYSEAQLDIASGDTENWHAELSRSSAPDDLSSWHLNAPQEVAVRAALSSPLSLIHGPPGTGKTTTASALAALFALRNIRAGAVAAILYCTSSNDAADLACLRVAQLSSSHFQAIKDVREREGGDEECSICMDRGCDVITACHHAFHASCLARALAAGTRGCPLCRRPLRQAGGGLRVIRVYSAEMERGDFSVPKRIDHPSARPRKPRTVREEMRRYAWHWRCHGVAPGQEPSEEAKICGQSYQRLLAAGPQSPHFDKLRAEYYLALSEARAAELRQADIIFATCISCRRAGFAASLQAEGAPELRQVIVDEAGQSMEPETLCPLTLARRAEAMVLVGDPKQLQPIVTCSFAERLGLGVSFLERISNAPHACPLLLSLQYRMHPEINAFPSAYFYHGRVRTDASIAQRPVGLLAHPNRPTSPAPLLFWDMGDTVSEQVTHVRTSESNAKSRHHSAEATYAVQLARALAVSLTRSQNSSQEAVAVLSWYNAQVAHITPQLQGSGVFVGGVVSSQGNEWDYVILSTVRSGSGSLGYLADEHLLNVALTRARKGCVVLGSSKALRSSGAWSDFLDHCEARGAVTSERPQLLRTNYS